MTLRQKILFVFRRSRSIRLRLFEQGEGPNEMLYGLNDLNSEKYVTSFIEGDDQQRGLLRLLTYPFDFVAARVVKLGFALHLSLDNFQELKSANVIVSTTDSCGLPIAMLKRLGLIKTPLLYISQGLSDRIADLGQQPYPTRLAYTFFYPFYRTLLRSAEQIVVLGEGAAKHLAATFALRPEEVHAIPFGIDAKFWRPALEGTTADYILSVGSDPARDYDTLLKAISNENLKIVTRLPIPKEYLKATIEVGTNYSDVELRELYQQARFVVTPLHDVTQPTGQSATLQAMACGKAVILTAIQGLWESEYLRHMETCYLVKPGDASDLQQAIAFLLANPAEAQRIGQNARRLVEERYTSQHFARSLERSIEACLSPSSPIH